MQSTPRNGDGTGITPAETISSRRNRRRFWTVLEKVAVIFAVLGVLVSAILSYSALAPKTYVDAKIKEVKDDSAAIATDHDARIRGVEGAVIRIDQHVEDDAKNQRTIIELLNRRR